MKANPLPDLNYLKEYVELDPSIPHGLRRKKSNIQFTGKPCGCKDGWKSSQYYHFTLNGKKYYNHRVIYAIHHNISDFEGKFVDHIDGDKLNNNINNLRLATTSENKLNAGRQKNNTSGYKNININKRAKSKPYRCEFDFQSKRIQIGTFATIEEAVEARDCYIKKLAKDFFKV